MMNENSEIVFMPPIISKINDMEYIGGMNEDLFDYQIQHGHKQ